MAADFSGLNFMYEPIQPWKCELNRQNFGDDESTLFNYMHHIWIRCKCEHAKNSTEPTASSTSDDTICSEVICEEEKAIYASKVTICSGVTCKEKATLICILCDIVLCILCSKVHLITKKGHAPCLIKTNPIAKRLLKRIKCSVCAIKCPTVICTVCSLIICATCHIKSHHNHNYKFLKSLQ